MTKTEEIENLRQAVAILNDPATSRMDDWKSKNWGFHDATWFRRMVGNWIAAGRRPGKFLQEKIVPLENIPAKGATIAEARRLLRFVKRRRFIAAKVERNPDRERLDRYNERVQINVEDGSLTDYYGDTVARVFTQLLRNGRNALLRECLNCKAWFVAPSTRRNYCTWKCADKEVHARWRKDERNEKIAEARKAIKNYPRRPRRFQHLDWKEYVERATDISKRFLTVAVRNGELSPPKD
jgi:hypothetical protein